MIISNLTTPAGIAIDWISLKLYWTDINSINVASLNGSNHSVLIEGDMQSPRDIVVHPMNG